MLLLLHSSRTRLAREAQGKGRPGKLRLPRQQTNTGIHQTIYLKHRHQLCTPSGESAKKNKKKLDGSRNSRDLARFPPRSTPVSNPAGPSLRRRRRRRQLAVVTSDNREDGQSTPPTDLQDGKQGHREERPNQTMSEEMKVDPSRAKALVEALQEVSAKVTAAAGNRNVSPSSPPPLSHISPSL